MWIQKLETRKMTDTKYEKDRLYYLDLASKLITCSSSISLFDNHCQFGIRAKSCSFPLHSTKPYPPPNFHKTLVPLVNPRSCQKKPQISLKKSFENFDTSLFTSSSSSTTPTPQRRRNWLLNTDSSSASSPPPLDDEGSSSATDLWPFFSIKICCFGSDLMHICWVHNRHHGSIKSRGDLHSTRSNFLQPWGNDEDI